MINGNGASTDQTDLLIHAIKCHEDEISNLKSAIAELQLRHDLMCSEYIHFTQRMNDIIDEYYSSQDFKPIHSIKSAYTAFTAFCSHLRFW